MNDAFGTAHRARASTQGVSEHVSPLPQPDARLLLRADAGQRKRDALAAFESQGSIIAELLRRQTLSFGEERFSVLARF